MGQLRQACAHFRQLPPEQRQKVFQRYHQFQQLPPAERQHMLENYHPLAADDARAAQGGAHPLASVPPQARALTKIP
jgi:hypothetical protein